ncbi:LuxR C-terminal-related transcriptional regulator [Amycolatopsis sacchari]
MSSMSDIVAGVPQRARDGGPRVLRVAYLGRPDVVARGVESIVAADPWLQWVGREQDEEPFHLLCSVTAPDVVVVEQAADREWRVLRALRYSVPRPAVVVLADPAVGPAPAGVAEVLARPVEPELLAAAIHAACGQAPVPAPRRAPAPTLLTAPELQVLSLVADGHRTDSIAALLGISPNTVKKRAHRLFVKLKVRDRAHAVAKAYEYGLLPAGHAPCPS